MEVVAALVERRFAAGTTIVEDDRPSPGIHLVIEGELDVLKVDPVTGQTQVLNTLVAGDTFGELGFATDETATATVAARTEVRAWVLSQEAMAGLACREQIVYRILERSVCQVRRISSMVAERLQENLAAQIRAREFGALFVYTTLIAAFHSEATYASDLAPIRILLSSWGYLLVGVVPVAGLVWWMKQPLADYGLSFHRLRRNVLEGIVVSAILVSGTIFFERLVRPVGTLFTWSHFEGWPASMTALYFALYPLHSFLQEFVMRGVMQGALSRFLSERHPVVPIAIVSFLFALTHENASGMAVLIFFLSFLLGLLYHRHQSLLGVTIIHTAIGTTAQALGYL